MNNNRINQIAEQTLSSLDEDVERILIRIDGLCPQFIDKFSELIVKECIDIINNQSFYFIDDVVGTTTVIELDQTINSITNHFNIK